MSTKSISNGGVEISARRPAPLRPLVPGTKNVPVREATALPGVVSDAILTANLRCHVLAAYLRGAATVALLGLALVCGGTRAARAQFFLTLPANPIVIDATQGGIATFTATLTNNNPFALYLNNDTFTLFNPATLDDTLFQNRFVTPLNNGPQPTLAANGGTLTLSLFTVTLPANTPLGIYSGTITLQGGAGPLDGDDLDTEQFAVQAVLPAAPPPPLVPEPGSATTLTALLLGTGLTAGRVLYRRIRTRIPA